MPALIHFPPIIWLPFSHTLLFLTFMCCKSPPIFSVHVRLSKCRFALHLPAFHAPFRRHLPRRRGKCRQQDQPQINNVRFPSVPQLTGLCQISSSHLRCSLRLLMRFLRFLPAVTPHGYSLRLLPRPAPNPQTLSSYPPPRTCRPWGLTWVQIDARLIVTL